MRVAEERAYWDNAAQDPEVDRKYIADVDTEACLDAIIPYLEHHQALEEATILEIGCGVGRLTVPIQDNYPNATVIGIDISNEMLKLAKRQTSLYKEPVYIHTNGRTIPSTTYGKYHAIYSMLVFQHLDAEGFKNYILEIGKHLRKDGVVRFQFIEGTEQEPFSRHYNLNEVQDWLHEAGIKLTNISGGLVHEQWTWVTGVKE